jgi:hypothetical protein
MLDLLMWASPAAFAAILYFTEAAPTLHNWLGMMHGYA